MADVVNLDRWRAAREGGDATLSARLGSAVERLDRALGARGWTRRAPGWAVTELLAIQGAVSLGIPEEAAARAEALASRLEARRARR